MRARLLRARTQRSTPLNRNSAPSAQDGPTEVPGAIKASHDDHSRIDALEELILARLDDDKAQDVVFIDLKGKSAVADGLIVASPTGSTAYNLAAAGPILHPEVEAWVVTAICPHSLTLRPFIFPDERRIQFAVLGQRNRAVLTVDGVKVAKIGPSDEVWLERHPHDHLFLRKVGHNYFSLLKEKLKFGERA